MRGHVEAAPGKWILLCFQVHGNMNHRFIGPIALPDVIERFFETGEVDQSKVPAFARPADSFTLIIDTHPQEFAGNIGIVTHSKPVFQISIIFSTQVNPVRILFVLIGIQTGKIPVVYYPLASPSFSVGPVLPALQEYVDQEPRFQLNI